MPVSRSEIGPVHIVLGRRQGDHEAPQTRAEKGHDRRAERPQHGGLVRMFAAALHQHFEGKGDEQYERDGFKSGKDRTEPDPVRGRAGVVIVVSDPDEAGNQRHGDNDVEPFFHDLAVHPGHFDQNEAEQGTQDQFPISLDPAMHDPPPPEAGFHGVVREVKGGQEKQRQTPQAAHQNQVNGSLAPLDQGHGHVEQQRQRHQYDTDLGGQRLLQVAAAHGG